MEMKVCTKFLYEMIENRAKLKKKKLSSKTQNSSSLKLKGPNIWNKKNQVYNAVQFDTFPYSTVKMTIWRDFFIEI